MTNKHQILEQAHEWLKNEGIYPFPTVTLVRDLLSLIEAEPIYDIRGYMQEKLLDNFQSAHNEELKKYFPPTT